jgi:hypothetical protein
MMATLLSAAAAILGSSGTWCKGANARDANGVWCPIGSSRAVSWDLYGALKRSQAQGSYSVADFDSAFAHLRAKVPVGFHHDNRDIEYYNDSLTFGDLAALFT